MGIPTDQLADKWFVDFWRNNANLRTLAAIDIIPGYTWRSGHKQSKSKTCCCNGYTVSYLALARQVMEAQLILVEPNNIFQVESATKLPKDVRSDGATYIDINTKDFLRLMILKLSLFQQITIG